MPRRRVVLDDGRTVQARWSTSAPERSTRQPERWTHPPERRAGEPERSTAVASLQDPAGQPTAVAREPSGNVALASVGGPDSSLRLARLSGSTWTTETADEYRNAGRESHVALDAANLPHVNYVESTRHEVWYAVRSATGVWTRQSVRAVGTGQESPAGGHTSIAAESGGRPHVVWYDAANSSVEQGDARRQLGCLLGGE